MMTSTFKKALLTGTALVAMGCVSHAQAATVIVDQGVVGISADPHAEPAISFVAGGTWASIDPDVNVTGSVVTYQDVNGHIAVQGSTTFTGNIGAHGKALAQLWSGISDVSTDIYNGDVYASVINLDAGSSIFNGKVEGGLTLSGAGSTTFNGDVTGNLSYANLNGAVTLGNGMTFDGDINSGATGGSGVGSLTLAGSATVLGAVSWADDGLAALAGGANGSKSVFAGNVNAETVTVNGTGAMVFEGKLRATEIDFADDGTVQLTYGQNTLGDIVSLDGTTGHGIGTLVFDGADGDVSILSGSVTGGLKAIVLKGNNASVTMEGDVFAADATTLNSSTLNIGGVFNIGDGQVINTTLTGEAKGVITGGNIVAGNIVTVSSKSLLHIDVSGIGGQNKIGDIFTVVDGSEAEAGDVAQLAAGNITSGILYTFTQTANEDSLQVELTDIKAMSDVASAGNNANAAAAIEDSCLATNANCHGLYANLLNAPSAAALNTLLESAQPANINGGAVTAMVDAGAAAFDVAGEKLAALRAGDTGMAAGTVPAGTGLWAQGYGRTSTQGMRDGIAGFDADMLGFAIGAETPKLGHGTTLGIALNYANTDVDSSNATTTAADIDSYGVTLYGSHDFCGGVFVDGQIGYAYNDIQTTRHNAGGAGLVANGDFSSDQYAARLRTGKDFAQAGGLYLTPSVMASYTALRTQGYTETGTGALLNVDGETYNVFKLGAGLQAEWRLKSASGEKLKPSVHANYAYDVTGDNIETTASFGGGGPAFQTTGADPARNEFNLGAGLTYTTQANFDLTATYDYTFKRDYTAHAGLLRGTVHF